VFWRRAGAKLLECLEELPLAQKTAFLLHHEDGITLDEIARALGVGFETAKSRLRYALVKLRTCMGAYLDAATLSWCQSPESDPNEADAEKAAGARRLGARA
jgi:RNA polymerase sigma-70 factor (ECF subfamily)